MRKAERKYYSNLVTEAEGNQSKTWKAINDIMGRGKTAAVLPDQLEGDQGRIITESQNIANMMNEFFSNVGPKLANKIPAVDKEPVTMIRRNRLLQSFFMQPVQEFEVLRRLQKLKANKSSGPDQLHPRLLKDIATWITPPLTHIINMSIQTGKVPDQMKLARIVPIHKGGSKKQATNFRPISILSSFSKIMEGAKLRDTFPSAIPFQERQKY